MGRRMQWIVGVVMLLVLGVVAQTARAARVQELVQAATGTFETTVVIADTASVGDFAPGNILYGFKLVADDAADDCGLYDTTTLGLASRTQGIYIDELSEPTDEDTIESDWPAPYILKTDLTVITNGFCTIYHDVKV